MEIHKIFKYFFIFDKLTLIEEGCFDRLLLLLPYCFTLQNKYHKNKRIFVHKNCNISTNNFNFNVKKIFLPFLPSFAFISHDFLLILYQHKTEEIELNGSIKSTLQFHFYILSEIAR